jgi:hypothetical protein
MKTVVKDIPEKRRKKIELWRKGLKREKEKKGMKVIEEVWLWDFRDEDDDDASVVVVASSGMNKGWRWRDPLIFY